MTERRVLGLVLALSLGALAQEYGPSAVVTYDIRSLTYRPGVVYVSPKYMTVIEFSELIDELGTSVPNLIQIKVSTSENMLFLRALRNAGSGDLVVRIAGYVALFRVVVDPRMEQPRRYVVTFPSVPKAPARGTVNPTPAPRQESAAPTVRPAEPGGQAKTPPAASPPGGLPPWLSVRFTHARTGDGDTAVVYYELKNNGQESLRLPVEGLSVRKGGIALPFRVVRTTFGQTVDVLAPGESATGAIIVPEAPEGVEVEWRLQDSKGNSYILRTREN
jgi:hypothetical protein